MIKKRVQKDGNIKGIYESSNILASNYNLKTQALTITFNYGGQYTYNNVPMTDYTRFETDSSQWIIFNKYIKDVYETINDGKVDTKLIKEELNQAIKNEALEYLTSIMSDMAKIIDDVGATDTIDLYRLDDLTARFEVYKTLL